MHTADIYNNTTVSVIVPTYNRATLLERALLSVMGQTRPADEVIVVDDGSTDHTTQLMAEQFPNVRYVRQAQSGVSAARNRGIEVASGKWIALLDSDDEWLPSKLAEQFAALAQNPPYRLCHTDEIWIRRGRRVNPKHKHAKYGGYIFKHCLPLCAISPSSVLIERSLLDEVGLFDAGLPACEDYDLWLRICANHPVLYIDRHLIVKYGGHDDQLSAKYWGMDRFRISALTKLLDSTQLVETDRRMVLETLIQKTDVYLIGARKREKWDEVNRYERWKTEWAQQLKNV